METFKIVIESTILLGTTIINAFVSSVAPHPHQPAHQSFANLICPNFPCIVASLLVTALFWYAWWLPHSWVKLRRGVMVWNYKDYLMTPRDATKKDKIISRRKALVQTSSTEESVRGSSSK